MNSENIKWRIKQRAAQGTSKLYNRLVATLEFKKE
jgi:hypothetical protein